MCVVTLSVHQSDRRAQVLYREQRRLKHAGRRTALASELPPSSPPLKSSNQTIILLPCLYAVRGPFMQLTVGRNMLAA